MRRLTVLAAAALSLLGLASCGDDEDRLSEAEFQEQANAICAEGNEEVDALFEDLPQDEPPSEEALEPLFDDFVENIRGQIDDVDELSPPEELEDDVDTFLSDAREALEGIEDDGPSSLLSEDDPFADVSAQAEDLGLEECA